MRVPEVDFWKKYFVWYFLLNIDLNKTLLSKKNRKKTSYIYIYLYKLKKAVIIKRSKSTEEPKLIEIKPNHWSIHFLYVYLLFTVTFSAFVKYIILLIEKNQTNNNYNNK